MSTTHVDEIVDAELVDEATPEDATPETPPTTTSSWRRESINVILAVLVVATVAGLVWGGSSLLDSTRGTGAGWAMLFVLLGIAVAILAAAGAASLRWRWRAAIAAAVAAACGWTAAKLSDGVAFGDLATASLGLLLLLLATGVVYLYGRYLYQP